MQNIKELNNRLGLFNIHQQTTEISNTRDCEFKNNPKCQMTAVFQDSKDKKWHTLYLAKKIGTWEIQRNPICFNCVEWIDKQLIKEKNAK